MIFLWSVDAGKPPMMVTADHPRLSDVNSNRVAAHMDVRDGYVRLPSSDENSPRVLDANKYANSLKLMPSKANTKCCVITSSLVSCRATIASLMSATSVRTLSWRAPEFRPPVRSTIKWRCYPLMYTTSDRRRSRPVGQDRGSADYSTSSCFCCWE